MTNPYPILPPISIIEAITAPELAGRPVVQCGDFEAERQDAQTLRDALTAGEDWYLPRRRTLELGKTMAMAAIQGDETALNDIALLLVNGLKYPIKAGANDPMDQITADLFQGLVEEGRRDLFRPILVAINNAARQRWTWGAEVRQAWRVQHDIPTIESEAGIPTSRDLSETEQNLFHGRWAPPSIARMFAGKAGWDRTCCNVFTFSAINIAWNAAPNRTDNIVSIADLTVGRITDILAMQRDAITTIADAQPWALWVIVSTINMGRVYERIWDIPANRDTLATLAQGLNDTEACSLLRQISRGDHESGLENIPEAETPFLYALVAQRPHLALSDWLARGVRYDLLLDGADLGTDEIPAVNDVLSLARHILSHQEQVPDWAATCNRIVEIVGVDRLISETSADPEADLSDLINLFQALECGASPDGTLKRFPCAQVALDRMLLMLPAHDQAGGSISEEDSLESSPSVVSEIKMADDRAPEAARRRKRTL